MESFSYVDIFAMKGIEYIIVMAFLVAFIYFSRYLAYRTPAAAAPEGRPAIFVDYFRVPEGYHFHQGHSWMKKEEGNLVTVGWDDFAQKLVGQVDSVDLPKVGSKLSQGERGWTLSVDGKSIPMLSPVDGEVVAINWKVVNQPETMNRDPYGQGWLLKVRSSRAPFNMKSLLSGKLARQWVEDVLEDLRSRNTESLGVVYQDGGLPVDGIARALYGDRWEGPVKEFFLVHEEA